MMRTSQFKKSATYIGEVMEGVQAIRIAKRGSRFAVICAVALASSTLAAELGVRAAARVFPSVRYLATAGLPADRAPYATFEDFLAAHTEHLISHRPWFNYWNNSLGFNDEEFDVPKPPGRFRIMALGDSFAYGLVPYPDNVLTIVEQRLRGRCSCRALDLLNLGMGATDVADYKSVLQLTHWTYQPDLVAVHFYMGNDGPDLHEALDGTDWRKWVPPLRASRYVRNVWRLRAATFLNGRELRSRLGGRTAPASVPRGGAVIDPHQPPLTDREPAMAAPSFDDDGFLRVARGELFRLYAPPRHAAHIEHAWAPTLNLLDAMRRAAIERGSRFVLVLFPSALQVYPNLRAHVLDGLHKRRQDGGIVSEDIDSTLPNRVLLDYCRRVNAPCIDVTPALRDAGAESPLPLYRLNDTHWNIRGNRVAAEAEAAALGALICAEPRFHC